MNQMAAPVLNKVRVLSKKQCKSKSGVFSNSNSMQFSDPQWIPIGSLINLTELQN